jgi:hypothetical protein
MRRTALHPGATAAAVLFTIAAAVAAVAAIAAAARNAASPTSVVLGKTAVYPESGCPVVDKCEVIAKVTGIQMMADGVPQPFKAPSDGQLVSWWLRLPRLHSTQISSFNSLFGGDPSARVAILRRGKRGRFRLVRQSETQALRPDLGAKGRVKYKLAEPLRIKKGDYVGLTAVTWVPAFAVNLDGNGNYWLASREKQRCDTPSSKSPKRFADYYKQSQAHLTASTVKLYQCKYATARLLYWARIVPDPVTTPPPTG